MTDDRVCDVLIVLHDLALGGTERVALRLASAWAGSGRRVRLLCGDPRGPASKWLDPAIDLTPCTPAIPRGRGARARLGRAVAAELRSRPAAILFVPGNYHWPVILHAASVRPRPVIVAQVSNPIWRPDKSLAGRVWAAARARRRLAAVDAAVVLTATEARVCDRLLGEGKAVHIAPPLFDEAPDPSPGCPIASPPIVLCLGRFVRQKGFDLGLRAFARGAQGDARLVFVGDGPERPNLERLAQRLGVADRVSFVGPVEDVGPWLRCARLLLVPSRYEGFGAVVAEAVALGTPVIATDRVPAAVELVVTPDRGVVVPFGRGDLLAAALHDQLARPPGPAAPEHLAAYLSATSAAHYAALFDHLLRSRSSDGTGEALQARSG